MSDDRPNNNPANRPALDKIRPLTSSTLRLEVPKKDGWHRHWFRGTPERIARAKQAGYTFVGAEDADVRNSDLGGDSNNHGSTDMGSLVSVVSGDDLDNAGQPGRLYLMECPIEYYDAARQILDARNESVAEALRGGKIALGEGGETPKDQGERYVKGVVPDLFNPHKRKTRRT